MLESSPNWGGQEERLLREAVWLRGGGHKVTIACPGHSATAGRARTEGLRVCAIPYRANYDLPGLAALSKLVRREAPDVIHARSSKDAWFALWFRVAGFPVVRSRHMTLAAGMPWGRKLVYRHGCTRLVAAASFIGLEMRRALGVAENRIDVIGEGVDTMEFSPGDGGALRRELGIEDEAPLFGLVSMLRRGKGHRCFLAAAQEVLVHRPDARFLIVGGASGGKDDIAAELRCSIGQGFSAFARPPVIMTGFRRDIPSVMRSIDCLVVPSSKEAQTLVIPQAFATGKPVIGSRVGGIPEILTDGVNGFLVEPRNAQQLAQRVLQLAENTDLRRRLGSAAREFAECELTFASKMQQLVECYRKAIAGVRGAPSTQSRASR